jgi:ribosomal protein L27
VKKGSDDTLYATAAGRVVFATIGRHRKNVSIEPVSA